MKKIGAISDNLGKMGLTKKGIWNSLFIWADEMDGKLNCLTDDGTENEWNCVVDYK